MMEKVLSNRWYPDSATQAKFLLGGIGTGNFSVGSRGQLCDWEIFNKPAVGGKLPYTFFAIRTQELDGRVGMKILESEMKAPYERSHGYDSWDSAGIPRFESARLCGEVSQVVVELRDSQLPVEVDMLGFSPFVPLNAADSGIPAAVLRYRVTNKTSAPLKVSLAGSLANAVGFKGYGRFCVMLTDGTLQNEYREEDSGRGLYFTSDLPQNHVKHGSMALMTTSSEHVTAKPEWVRSGWWDGAHDFWNDFEEDGQLMSVPARQDYQSVIQNDTVGLRIGAICVDFSLEGGEEKEIEFILSWYFPNRPARWLGHVFCNPDDGRIVQNYYARYYTDAWDVGCKLKARLPELEHQSQQFRQALYGTTLPMDMLDAMAANITVMRSNTCFRIEDGTFLGWEGCFDDAGCCEGSCSHVWNYQQALAFLFPELERTMRRVNFLYETAPSGEMSYRGNAIFGYPRYTELPPAVDGQLGTIVQLYRDWKLSGDDAFLREVWDGACRALDFAFTTYWDADGDRLFDGEQHNTYDIEFYGITSMTNAIFYAALKAASEMAAYLGDLARASKYDEAYRLGSQRMDQRLYNGEYYIQELENDGKYQYQYYDGCLSDQVLGQELAHVAGLGYILPQEHVASAVHAIYRYNFKPNLQNHINAQRTYALGDEGGLICCTWPHSKKPNVPFVYSDEVWTGIEYQVATHLIYEGYFEEAHTMVKALRARYDGVRRNPWNEVECGNHYVRAMASWGMLVAASGFQFDMTKGRISFAPKVSQENFSCFFSTAKCWGIYRQKKDPQTGALRPEIQVLYGDADSVSLQ